MWRITGSSISMPSRRLLSTTAAPPSKVISRRAWLAHQRKHPPKLASTPKEKPKKDETPWPKSVVYAGYVAAATFGPYFVAWFVASNPLARQFVFSKLPILEGPIRNHFGVQDPDAVAYVDSNGGDGIPLRLPEEWSEVVRHEQAVIDDLNASDIQVKIHRIQDGSQSSDVVQVPGSTLARRKDLLALVQQEESSANDNSSMSIAVDFQETTTSGLESEELSSDVMDNTSTTTTATTTMPKDPLLGTASIYSPWHYQQDMAALQQEQQTNSISDDQVRQSALEHRIQELEQELKNPSSRPVDDIIDEMNQTKSELRRLKWKKWVPWTS